jgi:hypothetical protein
MKKDQIAKAIDYPKAHPVVPGGSISRASGVESEAGLGSTFSGGLDRSARMPVAVLRRRGSRRTVGTPFGDWGLSRPMIPSHPMPPPARR